MGRNSCVSDLAPAPIPLLGECSTAPCRPLPPSQSSITASDLHGLLQSTDSSSLLIIDLRSFLCFNQQHVTAAINLCVPGAMMKRRGFSPALFERAICHASDRERFIARSSKMIILYDDAKTPLSESILGPLYHFLDNEGAAREVKWLQGGFEVMREQYPGDCRVICSTLASLFRCSSRNEIDIKPAPKTLHTETVRHPEPICIMQHLYLGDETTAANHEALLRLNIGYVLNAAKECENCFEMNKNFQYKRLNLVDNPNQSALAQMLDESFEFLNAAREQNKGVLVHCKAGQSRSVTIVIAYLMRTYKWTLSHAYSYVQQRKPDISPNLGFMGQLISFEASLFANKEGGCSLNTLLRGLPSPALHDDVRRTTPAALTDPLNSPFVRPLELPYHMS